MANSSIYAAFERMWQHIIAKIGTKADLAHNHDDIYYTEAEIDAALLAKADKVHNHDGVYAPADTLESAQAYADKAAGEATEGLKNELLNGAGAAYDTLKELGDLIDDNVDAIDALEKVAAGKADKEHTHDTYETKDDAQVKYDTITSAKADWSQNDETAIDYVKNRTHWAEESYEVIVPATTETTGIIPSNETLFGEGQYIVTVDGVEYSCQMYLNENNEMCLGDSRLCNGDMSNPVDLPFYAVSGWDMPLGSFEEIAMIYIYYPDSDTHTIEIKAVSEDLTYHTLDERYMPDTIARKSDFITETWTFTLEDGSTVTKAVYVG